MNVYTKSIEQTFSEGIFIEVYDEISHRWLIVCPFKNEILTNPDTISHYFRS